MAYEEKRNLEEDRGIEPILKFIRQVISKWWLIMIFIIIFAVAGFGIAKITYTEQYVSKITFNVSNKNSEMLGTNGSIISASDAQASVTIANNFKELIQKTNTPLHS